jgi:hypothetical protein
MALRHAISTKKIKVAHSRSSYIVFIGFFFPLAWYRGGAALGV